jgi:hypothetical protein
LYGQGGAGGGIGGLFLGVGGGDGVSATGGATGDGGTFTAGGGNAYGSKNYGSGSGPGVYGAGGATGNGGTFVGGATSGYGILATGTDKQGAKITAGADHANINLTRISAASPATLSDGDLWVDSSGLLKYYNGGSTYTLSHA